MNENRFPIITISDDELAEWYAAGWNYIEPAEIPGFHIVGWERGSPCVMPFSPSRTWTSEYIDSSRNRVPEDLESAGE